MVPGIFFSHDGYLDPGIFCLNQFARNWPDCPVRFFVPVNSQAAGERIPAEVAAGITLQIVACASPIKATLQALEAASGDSEWVFWCSSDRYPIVISHEALGAVARDLMAHPDKPRPETQAVRFVRWQDVSTIDADAPDVTIGGAIFKPASASNVGFWHPHFMRRSWLRALIARLPEEARLNDVQAAIAALDAEIPLRPLIAVRPLMKLEEPMWRGHATLNYAARLGRKGRRVQDHVVADATLTFASPDNMAGNYYWRAFAKDVQKELAPMAAGSAPIQVVSAGGTGGGEMASWLNRDAPPGVQVVASSQRRLPPTQALPGQRFVYVFGDPRDAVLSIFGGHAARETGGFPVSAMDHADRLSVLVSPMTAGWRLADFLAEGRDLLRLEEHLDFWLFADAPYEVVFVRAERMRESSGTLAAYLGLDVRPPDVPAPEPGWASLAFEQRDRLAGIYSYLVERLKALPDVFSVKDGVAATLDGKRVRLDVL